ncbi:MAG: hypothetical protein FIB06_03730 [Betaproteobacteria bacterium]|nr:hypothetical protein [Betaproteobacteria bacterium]
MTSLKMQLLAALLLAMTGCTTAPIGNKQLLGFLQDGVTTREEIYLRLAEPSATFEGGRILTYRLDEDGSGYVLSKRTGRGFTGKYSLVLAIDEKGILRRHSLVRIKEEFQN